MDGPADPAATPTEENLMTTTAPETTQYPIASREFETVLTTHEDCPTCQTAADDARVTASVTGSVGATASRESVSADGERRDQHLAVVRRLGTVVVFFKPTGCTQCDRTKDSLNQRDVPWMGVDVTECEEGMAYLQARGVQSVPFVHSDLGDWAHLRPDMLMKVGAAHKAASKAYYSN